MSDLVSVICISYNHEAFIEKALQSVFDQDHEAIELIILDDGSRDQSQRKIAQMVKGKEVQLKFHKKNQGYTKTFNQGLALAKGDYIIDFALDDLMKPGFISQSVKCLKSAGENYGVVFSNADYIDKEDQLVGNHNDLLFKKKLIKEIPSGDIFEWVLKRYFICTPTMVIRKEVFDRLGGYDESLAYEDFDFWVRSSRYWNYAFLNEVLFQKRKLKNSMSSQRYQHHFNEQMNSVYKVCRKAFHLCKTNNELKALYKRINYEYRQCLRTGNVNLAQEYKMLMKEAGGKMSMISRLAKRVNRSMFPFLQP